MAASKRYIGPSIENVTMARFVQEGADQLI
jgi:hypothetical protein